jgi:hypothetical protein
VTQVAALPRSGEVFLDARGEHRSLRVSWHPGDGIVVLSVWRADRCITTFRLDRAGVPSLIDALSEMQESDRQVRSPDLP